MEVLAVAIFLLAISSKRFGRDIAATVHAYEVELKRLRATNPPKGDV